MAIRRSYHFNTTGAARKDGMYLGDPCDIHLRQNGSYGSAPYGIDSDGDNVIGIGDRVGYKPNSASLPVKLVGGLHLTHQTVNANTNIGLDHQFVYVDTSGGNVTLTLPLLSTMPDDKVLRIFKLYRANLVILTPSGADTIDGLTGTQFSFVNPNYCITIIGDVASGEWRRIDSASMVTSLVNDIPFGSNISVPTGGAWTTLKTIANFPFSQRNFLVSLHGSGWYENAGEQARVEFGFFINSTYNGSFCFWHCPKSSEKFVYGGSYVGAATVNNLWQIDIKARLVSGTANFRIDTDSFMTSTIIKF